MHSRGVRGSWTAEQANQGGGNGGGNGERSSWPLKAYDTQSGRIILRDTFFGNLAFFCLRQGFGFGCCRNGVRLPFGVQFITRYLLSRTGEGGRG